MLAEKIYKIQKELEQKREDRRNQIKGMQQQPGGVQPNPQQLPGQQGVGGGGAGDSSQLTNMGPLSNAGSLGINMNGTCGY